MDLPCKQGELRDKATWQITFLLLSFERLDLSVGCLHMLADIQSCSDEQRRFQEKGFGTDVPKQGLAGAVMWENSFWRPSLLGELLRKDLEDAKPGLGVYK